jgi:hypothetical protein
MYFGIRKVKKVDGYNGKCSGAISDSTGYGTDAEFSIAYFGPFSLTPSD